MHKDRECADIVLYEGMAVMPGKRVLIVGGGGREHALAWGIARSKSVGEIFAAPGSDGMAGLAECVRIDPGQPELLAEWAEKNAIDLTVIGPEIYLEKGIVDAFKRRGLPVFGPSRAAASLEWSKVFAKEFMARHQVPTASFEVFDNALSAREYINNTPGPWVIKADGLAAGKGVIVADSREDALLAIDETMVDRKFGAAGQRVVIEEKLEGDELSLLAISDGKTFRSLLPAQDHKRVGDGDQGPNTGGMGAYAPTVLLTQELARQIDREVLLPTIRGLAEEGTPFIGVLYAGLMLTAEGPKVIEYNVRFGDPETQAIIPLLETDLFDLFVAAVNGKLEQFPELVWKKAFAACVVMASGGYPGNYDKGLSITGLDVLEPDAMVFHAGTRLKDGEWQTDGGRVLNIVGLGSGISEALEAAYKMVCGIRFNGAHYRKDIGWRELHRQRD